MQQCALAVLKSAMQTCGESFQKHADCLDKQVSQEYMFERCRKTETAFVECRSLIAKSSYDEPSAAVVAAASAEMAETTAKE